MPHNIDIRVNFGETASFQDVILNTKNLQVVVDQLTVAIGQLTTKAGKAHKGAAAAVKINADEYARMKERLEGVASETAKLNTRLEELGKHSRKNAVEIRAVKESLKLLNNEQTILIASTKKYEAELEKTAAKEAQIAAKRQVQNAKQIAAQMAQREALRQQLIATDALAFAQDKLNITSAKLLGGFKSIGAAMGITVSAYALFQIIKDATKAVTEFDLAQKKLQSILGESATDMKNIRDSAIEVGKASIFGAKGVSELQIELAKMGFLKEEIMAMQKAIVNLATATQEELAPASEVVANIIRAFELPATEATRVVDVMGKAFNESALDLSNFREAIKYVAPVAHQAGFSIEETVAALELLSQVGLKGSLAGTGLNNVLKAMMDSNSKLSRSIGGTVQGYEGFLSVLRKAQAEGWTSEKIFGVITQRATAAFTTFKNGADEMEAFKQGLLDASDIMEKQAGVQLESITYKTRMLTESYHALIIEMDDSSGVLSKTLKFFLDIGQALINSFSDSGKLIDTFQKDIYGNLGTISEAIPELFPENTFKAPASEVGKFAKSIDELTVGVQDLSDAEKHYYRTSLDDLQLYNSKAAAIRKKYDEDVKKANKQALTGVSAWNLGGPPGIAAQLVKQKDEASRAMQTALAELNKELPDAVEKFNALTQDVLKRWGKPLIDEFLKLTDESGLVQADAIMKGKLAKLATKYKNDVTRMRVIKIVGDEIAKLVEEKGPKTDGEKATSGDDPRIKLLEAELKKRLELLELQRKIANEEEQMFKAEMIQIKPTNERVLAVRELLKGYEASVETVKALNDALGLSPQAQIPQEAIDYQKQIDDMRKASDEKKAIALNNWEFDKKIENEKYNYAVQIAKLKGEDVEEIDKTHKAALEEADKRYITTTLNETNDFLNKLTKLYSGADKKIEDEEIKSFLQRAAERKKANDAVIKELSQSDTGKNANNKPFLQDLLGINDDEQWRLAEVGINTMKDQLSGLADAWVDSLDKIVDARNRMVDEAQQALQTELQLAELGFASNVTLKRKELEESKKLRKQALDDQKKAQRIQLAIESAEQASSLATAVADFIQDGAKFGLVGVALSLAAITTAFAIFSKFKALAKEQAAVQYEKGGWVHGDRHSQGGVMIEAEDKEFIVKRSMAIKHSTLVEAINRDDIKLNREFVNKEDVHLNKTYINEVKSSQLSANVSLDDSEDLKAIRKALETKIKRIEYHDGYRIEYIGNTINKIIPN